MKKLFTLFCIISSLVISAQGPVIEGTYYPARNTAIKQVWQTTSISLVPTIGPNQVWDYTQANGAFTNIADTFICKFIDPALTPYNQYFPEATHAVFLRTPLLGNPSDSLYQYFNVSYNGLHSIGGFNIQNKFDSTSTYTDWEFYSPTKMPYLYSKQDTAKYVAYANNFLGFRGKTKARKIKTFSYVGYGTLKLPNATYNNVALIREDFSAIDSVFIDFASNGNYTYVGPPQTSSGHVYQFYRNNTFGSAYLLYLNVNPGNTIVETAWYTLPVDFGSISGSVFTSTTETTPITSGEAYLYRENSNFVRQDILAKAQINASGNFNFDSIPHGEYRIAIRPDPAMYPNAMITYYGDTTNWIDASTIITTTLTSPGHKIHVQFHQAPTGSNNIHGQVMLDLGMQRSANADDMMASNPIPGVGIVVKRNPGSSSARTILTDSNGEYDLGALENGAYVLFVDIPGMHMTGTYSFNVNGTSTVSGLDYTAGTDSIHPTNMAIGIKELKNSAGGFMSAYPNPFTLNSSIALNLSQADDITLEVYNVLGAKIQTLDKGMKQAGTYTYNFSAKKLNYSSGIYFVKLTAGNKTDVIKLVEQ